MNASFGQFAVMLIVLADLMWVLHFLPPLSGWYAMPLVVAAAAGGRTIALTVFPNKPKKRRLN